MAVRPALLPVVAAFLLALAGCAGAPFLDASPNAPGNAPAPERRAEHVPSAESVELAERYARIERDLVARGLLRVDDGTADVPFDSRNLTENFMRIALFDEFIPLSDRFVAQETASALRRWEDRVEVSLEFGASVDAAARARDRATVERLVDRLSAAAQHPVVQVSGPGNMTVFVVDEDERRALEPRLRALVPGLSDNLVRTVTQMPPTVFCLMIAFSTEDTPHVYRRAVAIIRSEHPQRLRRSCYHEEIAQGLGLANDSFEVRPSVFNDDEEFALLTRHDELLVSILYDPRLSPGMTAAQAQPIVRTVAEELLPPRRRDDPARPPGLFDLPPLTEGS